ncbi:MAG: EscS/YscS/HrcS family type III secretion system export apparatus protein [Chitinivibrionales bacterium]|nr:EscS/YscS/HrcS family type III secretion system export apparatus protein [Chitinivibrionales bacterium]MBD3356598.1 EscS/YscS/HrcS family type III secretion system export apparatus protein [Chitinivibrionales bacterium]
MNEAELLHLTTRSLSLVLFLSMPPIIVAAIVGVGVGLFQAVTQIQEQTLSFAIKLIAVSVALVLTARWVGGELFENAVYLFDYIAQGG